MENIIQKSEEIFFYWYDKPNNELSREELLDCIKHLQGEVKRYKKESDRRMNIICDAIDTKFNLKNKEKK